MEKEDLGLLLSLRLLKKLNWSSSINQRFFYRTMLLLCSSETVIIKEKADTGLCFPLRMFVL